MNGRITAVAVVSLAALSVAGNNHLVARRAEKAISIWAVSDGEKIERDEINSPLKRSNSLSGDVFEAARYKLAKAIAAAKKR
jgi:hypothetical protein